VDSREPGHSPEKRKADYSAAISAASDARLPGALPNSAVLESRRRRTRRRWPGVSAPGSALRGPPGAHAGPPTKGMLTRRLVRPLAGSVARSIFLGCNCPARGRRV
jgi:anti-sigma factor RsiW